MFIKVVQEVGDDFYEGKCEECPYTLDGDECPFVKDERDCPIEPEDSALYSY